MSSKRLRTASRSTGPCAGNKVGLIDSSDVCFIDLSDSNIENGQVVGLQDKLDDLKLSHPHLFVGYKEPVGDWGKLSPAEFREELRERYGLPYH